MKKTLAMLLAAPILALFVGVGVLAIGISQTWNDRNTDVLIRNLSIACMLGGLIFGFVLSAIVGIVLYARWQQSQVGSHRGHQRQLYTPFPNQHLLEGPPSVPLLEARGKLYSSGAQGYEDIDPTLFGESTSEGTDWKEAS